MISYKLKQINIDAKDLGDVKFPNLADRVIEKSGHVDEFTMNDIKSNQKYNAKNRVELNGKMRYEKAIMTNIEDNHKFVKKLTDEQLFTAWMYQESKKKVEICEKTIAEIDEETKKSEVEIDEIVSQIPELKGQLEGEVEETQED